MNKEMSRNRYAHYSDEGMIQVRYGKYDNEETSTDECEQYKNDRTSRGHGQQYDDSKLTQNSSDKLGPNNYGGRKHTLTETVSTLDITNVFWVFFIKTIGKDAFKYMNILCFSVDY
jgi:hypothetical protein